MKTHKCKWCGKSIKDRDEREKHCHADFPTH